MKFRWVDQEVVTILKSVETQEKRQLGNKNGELVEKRSGYSKVLEVKTRITRIDPEQ